MTSSHEFVVLNGQGEALRNESASSENVWQLVEPKGDTPGADATVMVLGAATNRVESLADDENDDGFEEIQSPAAPAVTAATTDGDCGGEAEQKAKQRQMDDDIKRFQELKDAASARDGEEEERRREFERRELQEKVRREKEEHATRVQKEKEERALKQAKEEEEIKQRQESARKATFSRQREEASKSEDEKRRSILQDYNAAVTRLTADAREGAWKAEQDTLERLEVEAAAAAAEEASRQRLSGEPAAAVARACLKQEEGASQNENPVSTEHEEIERLAAALEAESCQRFQQRMESQNPNRRCDCLGASSGMHRQECPYS